MAAPNQVLKAQGTDLYFVDPDTNTIVKVGCPISIEGLSSPIEQIETTCLSDVARTYEAGLSSPGAASFTLNFNPTDPSHLLLNELFLARTSLQWAIGHSDGTSNPTVDSAGEIVVPATRSFILFNGYIADYTFAYALNATVQSQVSVQVSGDRVVVPKTV